MATTIKPDDMARMRCGTCGEKPLFTQRTAKKGAIFVGTCACKTRVFWIDKAEWQAWHQKTYGYEIKG